MFGFLALRFYFAISEYKNACFKVCTLGWSSPFSCDPYCMNPECNYNSLYYSEDRYSVFQHSGCFLECECDEEKLRNGVCDPECDNYQCGYDLGDCGYCSSGCFVDDLESDTCKTECSNIYCTYYNTNPCEVYCAPGCSVNKDLYMENTCKDECLDSSCLSYLYATCNYIECSYGCTLPLKGNSKCDLFCFNPDCNYDDGDCYCSKNCPNTSGQCETNETFIDPCDTESCRYKDGKCGFCASGCFKEHLGDGKCQLECNTGACHYDYGDCGCAPNCSYRYENSTSKFIQTGFSDQCSKYCLTLSCRFGVDFCPDTDLIKFSILNYITNPELYLTINRGTCNNLGCSDEDIDRFLNGTDSCEDLDNCYINTCSYCMGKANSVFENCIRQSLYYCLVYTSMLDVSYYENFINCPIGYDNIEKLKDLFGNNLWCLIEAITYTPYNYKEIFVNSSMISNGNGEKELPFKTMYYALANVYAQFTKIYLINEEIDFFIDYSAYGIPILNEPLYRDSSISELWILGSHSSQQKTRVYWKDDLRISPLAKKFFIQNIEFIGNFNMINYCERETCYYCPYVKYDSEFYYDDLNNIIDEYDYYQFYGSFCSDYSLMDVFTFTKEVYIENVIFTGFRWQYNSFIKNSGLLHLINVNFTKMQAKDTGSIIILECTENCIDLKFNYSQGLVSSIGSGYNNIENVATGSFIKGFGFGSIWIANITFSYNFAFNSLKKEESAYLIYSKNHLGSIRIEDCKFEANYFNYLVYIDVESVDYTPFYKVDENLISIPHSQQHFLMNNIDINSTYCSFGMVKYLMESYTHNIKITNLYIKNSVFGKNGIFVFEFKGEIKNSEFIKDILMFRKSEFDIYLAYVLPKSLIFENVTVTTSVTGKNVIFIKKNPVSILKYIKISQIMDGRFDGDKITEIYNIIELFSKNRETSYFTFIKDENPEVSCNEMVLVFQSPKLTIDSMFITEIYCEDHTTPVGLSISNNDQSNINNYSFTNVNVDALLGSALSVFNSSQTHIRDLKIRNVKNLLESIVWFDECNNIHIELAIISGIISKDNSPFVVTNSKTFNLSNFLISNISSLSSHGGCLSLSTGEFGSSFTIQSGSFSECVSKNAKGGAVYLNSIANMYNTSFQMYEVKILNSYSDEGSAIYISDNVNLKGEEESKLVRMVVINNDCKMGGVISDHHYSGKLVIDGMEMISNARGVFADFTNDDIELQIINSKINALTSLTSVFYLKSYLTGPSFYIQNVEITNAKKTAIEESNAKLFILQTIIFEANQGIYLHENAFCEANGLIITNSFDKAVNLEESSDFYCNNCEFTQNKNFIITVSKNSKFIFENCQIFSNHLNFGYLIYIDSGFEQESSLINSTINKNSLLSGSLIYMASSIFNIKDSYLIKNDGFSTDIHSIYLLNGILNIYDSTLQFNSLVDIGAFIHATVGSIVTAENCVFEKSFSKIGNIFGNNAKISINNCTFLDNTGGDIYTSETNLNILRSNFENSILSEIESGAVLINRNYKTEIKESVFKNISTNLKFSHLAYINDESSSQLEILKCTFFGYSEFVSAVYVKQINSVKINESKFFGFNTKEFSVLTAFSFSNGHTLYISNSVLSFNKCKKNGGGVNSENYNLQIENTEFSFNAALDSGGGIYFSSPNCNDCGLHLLGNTKFFNNSCKNDGGALKWKDYKPFIEDSVLFANNSAAYGPDLASNPLKFGFLQNGVLVDSVFANLSNVAPGKQITDTIQVVVLDIYNQFIHTENSLTANLILNDTDYLDFSISGKTIFYSINGILDLTGFILSGRPGSNAILKLISDDFKGYTIRNEVFNFSESVYIFIELRYCTKGEQIQASACVDCERDKYALSETKNCFDCPIGATCLGGSTIIVNDGYWRSSIESEVIYACDVFDACLKGNKTNELGSCSTGFKGVLCKSCEIGYSKTANGSCTKCPNDKANIMIMLIICLAISILSFTLVKTTLASAFSPKSLHSIYIKIFTNYLQLVFIVTQLNLSWPTYIAQFFNVQRQSSSVSNQLSSLDCFISSRNPENVENIYYTKLCFISALPFIIIAISYSFWIFFSIFIESYKYLKREAFTTIIVLFFLVYPTIVKSMFSNFSCIDIDKMKSYLNEDTSVECWNSNYKKFSFTIVIPSIIMWAIGFPILLLMLMTKHKRKQHLDYYRVVFGFLYNGYKQNRFYWEFLIMLRKILLITIIITSYSQAHALQALNLILVLLLSIYLHHSYQPYNSSELNKMEMQALNVAAMTTYFGLYYLSKSIGNSVQILLFVLIILGNSYFIIHWIYYMFRAMVDIFIKFFPRFRQFFKKGDTYNEEFYIEEILRKGVIFNQLEGENSYTFINIEKLDEDEIFNYKSLEQVYIDVAKRDINKHNSEKFK